MKCSNCGAENEEGYRFCGTCGTPLYVPMAVLAKPNSGIPSSKSHFGISVRAFLVLLIVIGCSLIAIIAHVQVPPKTDTSESVMAWIKAKHFVTDNLKAPATAKFDDCPLQQCVTPLGMNRYSVSSYVDAQNSFGALIRTRWVAVVREEGDMWYLESLKLP